MMTTILPICLLSIAIDRTQASPIYTILAKGALYQTSSHLPTTPPVTRSEHPNGKAIKGNDRGAIIAGTVTTGVVVFAIIIVGLAIYKQYLIGKALAKEQASAPDGIQKRRRSAREVVSTFFRRPVPIPEDSDTESIVSDNHQPRRASVDSTSAQVGTRGELKEEEQPKAPAKAAKVLGLGERAWHRRRSSQPVPPQRSPRREQAKRSSRTPAMRRSGSSCTMSTLGMELLRDTMQEPLPERFSQETRRKSPWQPSHQRQDSEDLRSHASRKSSGWYFIPEMRSHGSPFITESMLTEETSRPTEVKALERTVARESAQGSFFPLGDNKI